MSEKSEKSEKMSEKFYSVKARRVYFSMTTTQTTVKINLAAAPTEQKLTERQQQQRVVKWAQEYETELPELKLLYHVPNERKCSPQQGRQLKLMGVKSGIPDLCLPVARAGFHGLYIEMKSEKGRVSENQKFWIENLTVQGFQTAVCHSWLEAVQVLENYLTEA